MGLVVLQKGGRSQVGSPTAAGGSREARDVLPRQQDSGRLQLGRLKPPRAPEPHSLACSRSFWPVKLPRMTSSSFICSLQVEWGWAAVTSKGHQRVRKSQRQAARNGHATTACPLIVPPPAAP